MTDQNPLPRWAYVPGRGICRVLDYLGDGQFRVLTKGDDRLIRSRNQLQFRKSER
ncbi:hypothetical protein [Curtobacterium phage Parvaparticeps]|nr:hypothetical protein [Curtobacterium phage Parvaparticeps]